MCSLYFIYTTTTISVRCLVSSSEMTSEQQTKSTASQTPHTVPTFNAKTIKATIFRTLALKMGNEFKNYTCSPITCRAFSKSYTTPSYLLIKNRSIYYRLHTPVQKIAIFETTSSNIFALHALHEALDALTMFFKILSSLLKWHNMTSRSTH